MMTLGYLILLKISYYYLYLLSDLNAKLEEDSLLARCYYPIRMIFKEYQVLNVEFFFKFYTLDLKYYYLY